MWKTVEKLNSKAVKRSKNQRKRGKESKERIKEREETIVKGRTKHSY